MICVLSLVVALWPAAPNLPRARAAANRKAGHSTVRSTNALEGRDCQGWRMRHSVRIAPATANLPSTGPSWRAT